jgi:hypothetical protein
MPLAFPEALKITGMLILASQASWQPSHLIQQSRDAANGMSMLTLLSQRCADNMTRNPRNM